MGQFVLGTQARDGTGPGMSAWARAAHDHRQAGGRASEVRPWTIAEKPRVNPATESKSARSPRELCTRQTPQEGKGIFALLKGTTHATIFDLLLPSARSRLRYERHGDADGQAADLYRPDVRGRAMTAAGRG